MGGISILGIIGGVLYVIAGLLVARALISWFPDARGHPLVQLLHELTDPIMLPLRRLIPPVGNIDISLMIAVFFLMTLARLLSRL